MTIEHRRDSRGQHYARIHGPGGVLTTPKREHIWTDAEAVEWAGVTVGSAESASAPGHLPDVAIVITTSDSDTRFLWEALESALTQTVPAAEIVVVDDSSQHAAVRARVLQMDPGLSRVKVVAVDHRDACLSRQAGMDATTADLLVFLDADNVLEPHFLETLVPLLADGRAALAYSTATVIGPDGEERGRHRYIRPTTRDQLRRENRIDTCCLVRRDAIEDAGGWADGRGTHRFHDWHLWLRITGLGWPTVYVDEPLFRYRQHRESMSAKSDLSRDQQARQAIMQDLYHVAVVTCFSGRRWAYQRTIQSYQRLGWERDRLHWIAVNNTLDPDTFALMPSVPSTWGSAAIVRDDVRAIPEASNDQLANDQQLRLRHTVQLGRVIRRLYAEEVAQHLPARCDLVLTLEDDIELLGEDVIPRLLSAMEPDVAAVGAVVNCRFTDYMVGPIAWDVFSERPYRAGHAPDPGEDAKPIDVSGVAFGATLWRAEVWRDCMPHRLRVNDDPGNDPAWFDTTFAAEVRRAGWRFKLHPGVRTRHWKENGDWV